jgi:hypothetical protein
MLTDLGPAPVGKVTWGAKVGVGLGGGSVEQDGDVLLPLFATAKSGLPSPLMSPMLTEEGLSQ